MKGKYIEIPTAPDFDTMEHFTFEEIDGPVKPNPFNYYISAEERSKGLVPNSYKYYTGIYFLMNGWELIYIGKTTTLANRTKLHKNKYDKIFDGLFFLPIEEGLEMDVLEKIYIDMYRPKYNKAM